MDRDGQQTLLLSDRGRVIRSAAQPQVTIGAAQELDKKILKLRGEQ